MTHSKSNPDVELSAYAADLGKLIGNLHSLEYLLRACLYETDQSAALPEGLDWYRVKVGDELPENTLTSFESLGELIDRYNRDVATSDEQRVDRNIVDLRDAVAHGRVSGALGSAHVTLLKFTKPRNGRVQVTFASALTAEWFAEQRQRVFAEMNKVYSAGGWS